jgi:hypothetical protein
VTPEGPPTGADPDLVDLVVIDLGENDLFLKSHRIIAAAIK